MAKTWFTSDIHFGHKNILKFCPNTRKYKDTVEMDEALIAKWNSMVSVEDTVYIIGDVFFHKAGRAISIVSRLNGKLNLVLGNHDEVIINNPELSMLFESISPYKTITIDGQYVVLFHFPIWEWDRMHRGAYHLYGHVHGKESIPGRAMDVGIDTRTDNGLWSWEEVHALLSKKAIRTHH